MNTHPTTLDTIPGTDYDRQKDCKSNIPLFVGVGNLPTLNLTVSIAVKMNVYPDVCIPKLPCGVLQSAANL